MNLHKAKYTFGIHNVITPKCWKTKRITSHGIVNTEKNQYNIKQSQLKDSNKTRQVIGYFE